MKIKKLPQELINQIAAGEMIERPASIVKELVENSLDAGAKKIEIDIEAGARQLICVHDDGCGIAKEELKLAVSSHTTSKISSFKDLENVSSLGFRGEALGSIQSISRFEIASKTKIQEEGWVLRIGDHPEELEPIAHPCGTTIKVKDLFFNVPVRRKFLKSEKTEFSQIEELVKRLALSRCDVTFILRHDQKEILRLPAATNQLQIEKRINKLFGKNFLQHARYVDIENQQLQLKGWIALPTFSRSQIDLQYFYLNGRMIRDKLINHAIRQAYQDLLYEGRQAAYILHFQVPGPEVDVNVHPTKYEVRFRQPRLVHDFLQQSLSRILNHESEISSESESSLLYRYEPASFSDESQIPHIKQTELPEYISTTLQTETLIGLFNQRYLIVENLQELMMIDIQLLFAERIETTFINSYEKGESIPMRPLLFPLKIPLKSSLFSLVEKNLEMFSQLSIRLQIISEQTLLVREIPNLLGECDLEKLMLQSLEFLNQQTQDLPLQKLIKIIAQSAKNSHNKLEQAHIEGFFKYWQSLPLEKQRQVSQCVFKK